MDKAWTSLRFLETEPTARKYLAACYHGMGLEHFDRLAFQQSSRFLYLWKQARQFYQTAMDADLSIQPLLLFYGCSHLLKGMLLTRDPAYPQNSRVLQHGVTTRKLKRSAYLLTEDEIRPQKEGLFAHLAQVFSLSPLQDRYFAHDLFASIPGVSHAYAVTTSKELFWVRMEMTKLAPPKELEAMYSGAWITVCFPEGKDGPLSYSTETFMQYIRRLTPPACKLDHVRWREGTIKEMLLPQFALSQLEQHPLFRVQEQTLFFWNGPSTSPPLPEWASHYLLLYLLSMLCRYETEWWGELTLSHGFAERFLVELFLEHHAATFPTVIMKQIQQNSRLILPTP